MLPPHTPTLHVCLFLVGWLVGVGADDVVAAVSAEHHGAFEAAEVISGEVRVHCEEEGEAAWDIDGNSTTVIVDGVEQDAPTRWMHAGDHFISFAPLWSVSLMRFSSETCKVVHAPKTKILRYTGEGSCGVGDVACAGSVRFTLECRKAAVVTVETGNATTGQFFINGGWAVWEGVWNGEVARGRTTVAFGAASLDMVRVVGDCEIIPPPSKNSIDWFLTASATVAVMSPYIGGPLSGGRLYLTAGGCSVGPSEPYLYPFQAALFNDDEDALAPFVMDFAAVGIVAGLHYVVTKKFARRNNWARTFFPNGTIWFCSCMATGVFYAAVVMTAHGGSGLKPVGGIMLPLTLLAAFGLLKFQREIAISAHYLTVPPRGRFEYFIFGSGEWSDRFDGFLSKYGTMFGCYKPVATRFAVAEVVFWAVIIGVKGARMACRIEDLVMSSLNVVFTMLLVVQRPYRHPRNTFFDAASLIFIAVGLALNIPALLTCSEVIVMLRTVIDTSLWIFISTSSDREEQSMRGGNTLVSTMYIEEGITGLTAIDLEQINDGGSISSIGSGAYIGPCISSETLRLSKPLDSTVTSISVTDEDVAVVPPRRRQPLLRSRGPHPFLNAKLKPLVKKVEETNRRGSSGDESVASLVESEEN